MMAPIIRAGRLMSGPGVPLNVLSPSPRRRPDLYDDAQGPATYSHDNEHLDFRQIRILPTTDEILAVEKPIYIPRKDLCQANPIPAGPERLKDLLFRQLRFDNLEHVRDISYSAAQIVFLDSASSSHLEAAHGSEISTQHPTLLRSLSLEEDGIQYIRQETLAGNRYFLYQDVKIEEMVPHEQQSLLVRMSYDCPRFMRGRSLHHTGRFEEGMLVALLCLDNETKELDISFLQVHGAQSTDSMKSRGGAGSRAAVLGSFLPNTNVAGIAHFAKLAQKLRPNTTLAMIEFPKVLHAGFYHCLKRLQEMHSFAFEQHVAPAWSVAQIDEILNRTLLTDGPQTIESSPPRYALEPEFSWNLAPVGLAEHRDSLRYLTPSRLELDANDILQKTILDHGQAIALCHCLQNDFAFVQGPPGTGKTFLGIHLTRVLLASRRSEKPVLVVCLTNHALDSFLGGLKDAGVSKLLRIGSGSTEEWTDAINLRTLNRKNRFSDNEVHKKFGLKDVQQKTFADIQDWCSAQSSWTLSGRTSWYIVQDIVACDNPNLFAQFQTIADTSYLRFNMFEFWSGGGDVSKMRLLKSMLPSIKAGEKLDIDSIFDDLCGRTEQQHTQFGSDSIWRITPAGRKELVDAWAARVDFDALVADLSSSFAEHQESLRQSRCIAADRNIRTMLNYDVIGVTTTGCASRWDLLNEIDFEIVICEEAAEVMEPHALCALLPSVQHAIFIGDPLQLRPEVQQRPMSLECSSDYRLDESVFERMAMPQDAAACAVPRARLNIQRRMHREIADITRLTYPYLQDHASTDDHVPTAGLDQRVFWWDHRVPELADAGASKSHVNHHEVDMVHSLVGYLLKTNAYAPGDIAILTPYTGQLAALHDVLSTICKLWLSEKDRELLLGEDLLDLDKLTPRKKDAVAMSELLRVTTVDNFQGEEAKIIILSTVRSGGRPGFLATQNRVNVACSRARDGFYIVGNSDTLRHVPIWKDILQVFGPRVGFELVTRCDRHPGHRFAVYQPEDFSLVSECPVVCGHQLRCGHTCDQKCHSLDLHGEDAIMPCLQQCQKVQYCGHRCLRACSVSCGACLVSTGEIMLDCGHPGLTLCSGEVPKCTHLLGQRTLVCGHIIDIRCGGDRPNAEVQCKQPCLATLECGHCCKGICGQCCKEGPKPCAEACAKPLPCGHPCKAECGHDNAGCPPCEQVREITCEHGVRTHPCSAPPEPCMKLCDSDNAEKPKRVLCCLSGVRQYQDLDQPWISDVVEKVHMTINSAIMRFAAATTAIAKDLEASFDAYTLAIRPGILAWDSNQGQVVRRVTDPKALRTRIVRFNDGVVRPFENQLSSMSDICSLASIRLEAIEYRAISVRLAEHLRMAKFMMSSVIDPTYQVQRMGEEICRLTQAEALTYLLRDLPTFLKSHGPGIASSPSLDVEFRLLEVHLWLTAYDALRTMDSTSNALDHKEIPRFLTSLEAVIDLSKRYSMKSFVDTAKKYVYILEGDMHDSTKIVIPAVASDSLRTMERNLGASSYGTCNIIMCDKKHPYDATVFGSGCPECGLRVEMSDEVYANMSQHLKEDDFLEAMRRPSAEVRAAASSPEDSISSIDVPHARHASDEPGIGGDFSTTETPIISNEEKFLAYLKMLEVRPKTTTTAVAVLPTIQEDAPGELVASDGWVLVNAAEHAEATDDLKNEQAVDGQPKDDSAMEQAVTNEERFLAAMRKISASEGPAGPAASYR